MISALRRLTQEDQTFEASLGYTTRSCQENKEGKGSSSNRDITFKEKYMGQEGSRRKRCLGCAGGSP